MVVACAALVLALPAPAAEKGGKPGDRGRQPVSSQAGPPQDPDSPPSEQTPPPDEESSPPEEGSPPSSEDPGPLQGAEVPEDIGGEGTPGADEPSRSPFGEDPGAGPQEGSSPPAGAEPPPGERRAGIQRLGPPQTDEAPAGVDRRPRRRPEATRLEGARPQGRRESRTPGAAVRGVVRSAGPAARASSSPLAAVAAGEPAAPRSRDRRPEALPPDQPLPVRIVPRPLRRIVEVVPKELWAAIGALALLALALASASWLQTRRARRLKRQRAELLEEVGVLQAALLPKVSADVPASVAYAPAKGDRAGGDFYDAFTLPDGTGGIILGEVSPEGRESLARTTFARYTLRAYLEAGMTPREVVKVGSQALAEHLASGSAAVTVASYDPVSGRFTYASAGSGPPLIVGPQSFEPVTACSAPPIGIDEPTGFRQTTVTLTQGSVACLYTRGLIESRHDGRPLGVETLEAELRALPPHADADALLERVEALADDVAADLAVCLVRAPEGAPADGMRIEELEVDEREVGDSLELFLRACGVPLHEVPGILREAGEAARREGTATVRVRMTDFRPGVDIVPGNLVRLEDRRAVVL